MLIPLEGGENSDIITDGAEIMARLSFGADGVTGSENDALNETDCVSHLCTGAIILGRTAFALFC